MAAPGGVLVVTGVTACRVAGEFGLKGQPPFAEHGSLPEHAELARLFFAQFEVRGAEFMSERESGGK